MKTIVEVYDHDVAECCSDEREMSGLEKIIEHYPYLTGPELKEVLELRNKLDYFDKKNYLHARLEEYSKYKDKWFKHNHNRNRNTEVYSRINQYFIEWNELYVNVSSYIISENGIAFQEENKYLVDRFLELEPKAISSQKYYSIRDQFDNLTNNYQGKTSANICSDYKAKQKFMH